MRSAHNSTLLPDVLLIAYRNGFFPMADPDTGSILWHRPDPRAIIPLDSIQIPRSLRQVIRKGAFRVTTDEAFLQVITNCSQRADSWISPEIIEAYHQLHLMGFAHSFESWSSDVLVGGLYGVAVNGAFFGESMFSVQSNASKTAFVHLVAHLNICGFRLLDTQYINEFTKQLGAIEIPDADYQILLADALTAAVNFNGK
jgi:leucyl/phenylalanyl-tRNA--protein transferase